jgi:hypothetical protein
VAASLLAPALGFVVLGSWPGLTASSRHIHILFPKVLEFFWIMLKTKNTYFTLVCMYVCTYVGR